MTRYLVFEPPGAAAPSARAVFVRDGFSVFGLVFSFLWLWRHGLVLSGLAVLALMVACAVLASVDGFGAAAMLTAVCLALLVALEGPSLRAASYRSRGWQERAAFEADGIDAAEILYFTPVAASSMIEEVRQPLQPARAVPSSGPRCNRGLIDLWGAS